MHTHYSLDHERDHRDDTVERPHEGRAVPEPTTRQEITELQRLRDDHGGAFEAYLRHIWEGCPIEQMGDDFANTYWASHERLDQFADDMIDALGWRQARDRLIRDEAIPGNVLVFDRDAMLEQLIQDYEFIQVDGWIHGFVK